MPPAPTRQTWTGVLLCADGGHVEDGVAPLHLERDGLPHGAALHEGVQGPGEGVRLHGQLALGADQGLQDPGELDGDRGHR